MRHFLGLRDMDPARLLALIEQTRVLRADVRAGTFGSDRLRSKAIALLFFEPSTRTRFSFEVACHRLGAHPLAFSASTSSTVKGETTLDTARVLRAVGADAFVIRQKQIGGAAELAAELDLPVINAGDGTAEHPTQGLLDLVTIRDHFDKFEGLRVGIVGDVKHSRVTRSACYALQSLGAQIVLGGPPALRAHDLEQLGCEYRPQLDDIVSDVDVLMMLRIQHERITGGLEHSDTYRSAWGLTAERARNLADHAIVMHPGPLNRGVEIDSEVADGPKSVILDQIANGVFARMAVLMDVFR